MRGNIKNLRRGGPGRPKGCKNKVPATFKASIKAVFEKVMADDPMLIENAVLKGLRGKPRESFPFVQIAAHYIDGKPEDVVKLKGRVVLPPYQIIAPPGAALPPASTDPESDE